VQIATSSLCELYGYSRISGKIANDLEWNACLTYFLTLEQELCPETTLFLQESMIFLFNLGILKLELTSIYRFLQQIWMSNRKPKKNNSFRNTKTRNVKTWNFFEIFNLWRLPLPPRCTLWKETADSGMISPTMITDTVLQYVTWKTNFPQWQFKPSVADVLGSGNVSDTVEFA